VKNHILLTALIFFAALPCLAQQPPSARSGFALADGDRVVFYGDSITEQRLYTTDIEEFLLTRYPDRRFDVFQSGVGGDKVSGGHLGPIDLRLHRDLFSHNPTVVTIMLGMNDGFYRQYDSDIFTSYANGYRYIVDEIQKRAPAARITILKPSPYDDVSRAEMLPGGYNAVLIRFGNFLGELATEKKTGLADLNSPVVDALRKAKVEGPAFATTLIPDRIHPGPAIHWLMAESVLKSWNATPEVTSVTVDAATAVVAAEFNADVTHLAKTPAGLSWTQQDHALPLPFGPLDADPQTELALRSSDLITALDQETLKVTGLAVGSYQLKIDDRLIGTYSAEKLEKGVNLALLETPMLEQSRRVAHDTDLKNGTDRPWFEMNAKSPDEIVPETLKALADASDKAAAQARKDALPVPHRYEIAAVEAPVTAPIPKKRKHG
jgi:lysophospholipase L1-like esterase